MPTHDALFRRIEELHSGRPWGAVLDAGTGAHSLRWVTSLPTTRWAAVTADEAMRKDVLRTIENEGLRRRLHDQVLIGNWTDPLLLAGQRFDVVLADYLIGAVDGFAPYFQERLFQRLRPHVDGRLYVVGLEPWPDHSDDPGGALILAITRLRDACILLAGDRCYREYPRRWVEARLEADGYRIEHASSVPILLRERFVDGQLDVCVRKLPRIAHDGLRESLKGRIAELRDRAREHLRAVGPIPFGQDWIVAAEPPAA